MTFPAGGNATWCVCSNSLPSNFRDRVRLCNRLQTRRKVRGLADDRLLLSGTRTNQVADDHESGAAWSMPCAAPSRCRTAWSSAMPVIRAGLEFRIGIHLGDVVEESDGDLMGDGVTIAARKRQPRKEPGKANNLPLVRKVSLSAV